MGIRNGKYVRSIKKILYEYGNTEDAVYGPDLFERLDCVSADDGEKGKVLIECLREVVADYTNTNPAVVCPPFEYDSDRFEIIVPMVEPVQSSNEQRLSYVSGLIQYYKNTFEQFIELLDHPDQAPVIYHTDLVKPSQYTFGVIKGLNNDEPSLYLTDLDPELNCVATKDEFSWVIDKHYQAQVIELAGLCHYYQKVNVINTDYSKLTSLLSMNGYGHIVEKMNSAFEHGTTPYEIEEEFLEQYS